MRVDRVLLCVLGSLIAFSCIARADGAWIPPAGHGYVNLGFSEKKASTSWDVKGNVYTNTTNVDGRQVPSYHDFRYGYLSGEVGIVKNLSFRGLMAYLNGLEGPSTDYYRNSGLTDAWFGFKYGLRQKTAFPMAVAVTGRVPWFYDLGKVPYNRFLFDTDGEIIGNSPEWRGVLKEDLTLSYIVSHSFMQGRGWASLEAGYTWRAGSPADQIPVWVEAGYPLPFLNAAVKGTATFVRSRYNQSPRQPDDRFGQGAVNNFNEASMLRLAGSFWVPISDHFGVEAGYGQWVWGRSARRYKEPFISVGYRR